MRGNGDDFPSCVTSLQRLGHNNIHLLLPLNLDLRSPERRLHVPQRGEQAQITPVARRRSLHLRFSHSHWPVVVYLQWIQRRLFLREDGVIIVGLLGMRLQELATWAAPSDSYFLRAACLHLCL